MANPSATFKAQLRQAFADIAVGQTFTFRRTFTEGDLTAFCGITGDYNPYHIDEIFAQESWYSRRIVPGLLTGSMMTHIGGLLGFLATEMNFKFLAPVYVGDTVTCIVTINGKDEASRRVLASTQYINQHGQIVLTAEFAGFPSNIRLVK